jgi:hypothetical protein
MTLLAVITKQDVILKILSHLNVPRYALMADEPSAAYYDMTGEPVAKVMSGCFTDTYPPRSGSPLNPEAGVCTAQEASSDFRRERLRCSAIVRLAPPRSARGSHPPRRPALRARCDGRCRQ